MAFEATSDGNNFFTAKLDEVVSYFKFPNPLFDIAVFPVVLARDTEKGQVFGVLRGNWKKFLTFAPSLTQVNSTAPDGFDGFSADGHALYARYTEHEAAAKVAGKAGK